MKAALVLLTGCAMGTDAGVLQRGVAEGAGGSLAAHLGAGLVPDEILALQLDVRVDVAASGSRFAPGASLLGGLPVLGGRVLARAGIWNGVLSSRAERAVTPSFELAGYIPLREDPGSKRFTGPASNGIVFGVREDLDYAAYTTIFVGVALFIVPGP
ncbi:MAG: hypothetical protein ACM31C_23175 [Acidobacteriota bacterium]